MQRLVLFDIDETMISSDGAGRRAISKVLYEHYGVPEDAMRVSMSGKTDPQILQEIFSNCGKQSVFDDHFQHIFELYLGVLEEEIATSRYWIVHDGVMELLDELVLNDQVFIGLLTGNIERGAFMKLNHCGLTKYFEIGAYGSDSANRLDLPAVAAERAKSKFQRTFSPPEIVIIGDSVNDILCAKGFGAKSIAVNTGKTTWQELEALGPDYLFSSLKDTQKVLNAIFAEHV